jgi:hypothetical protein
MDVTTNEGSAPSGTGGGDGTAALAASLKNQTHNPEEGS